MTARWQHAVVLEREKERKRREGEREREAGRERERERDLVLRNDDKSNGTRSGIMRTHI
jgi:hypothetical protein